MPVEVDVEEKETKAVRELRRSGNSVVVSLPPQVLRQANFVVGDELVVAAAFEGGEIQLRRADSERSTDESTDE